MNKRKRPTTVTYVHDWNSLLDLQRQKNHASKAEDIVYDV